VKTHTSFKKWFGSFRSLLNDGIEPSDIRQAVEDNIPVENLENYFCNMRSLTKIGYDESEAHDIAMAAVELDIINADEAYCGFHHSDVDFVQELLEDIGDIPDLPFYVHIDWESTARDVMMDYASQDGHYFRLL